MDTRFLVVCPASLSEKQVRERLAAHGLVVDEAYGKVVIDHQSGSYVLRGVGDSGEIEEASLELGLTFFPDSSVGPT